MKLHTLAQMLDRLRRGKPKRAPKLEEVEITEASASSIDKVFGQFLMKHVQP